MKERRRGGGGLEKKFSSNEKKKKEEKTLSCQNSMSLYLKRELVIGRESEGRRGLETRGDRGEGSSAV